MTGAHAFFFAGKGITAARWFKSWLWAFQVLLRSFWRSRYGSDVAALTCGPFVVLWCEEIPDKAPTMDHDIDLSNAIALANSATVSSTTRTGRAPGSYMNIDQPAHEYHADRSALSCSLIKPLLVSPAHFQSALLARDTGSGAKDFGSLLHLLVLEPHLVGQEVAVYPGVGHGRDKAYIAFVDANIGRLVVDEPTFARARRLADKVLHRTYKGRALGAFLDEAVTEASIYFVEPVSGLELRIRPDIYHPDVTFDLKSTRHGSSGDFLRDVVGLHYDLQAFMYSLGRSLFEGTGRPAPFVFIAAESEDPHSVMALEAGSSVLDNGARKFQECVSVYQACSAADYWPDLGCESTLEIDHWHQFRPTQTWRTALSGSVAG